MVVVYDGMNVKLQLYTALHSHFVELYSALKQTICSLSLDSNAPKCPSEVNDGNPSVDIYVDALQDSAWLLTCFETMASKESGSVADSKFRAMEDKFQSLDCKIDDKLVNVSNQLGNLDNKLDTILSFLQGNRGN
jgi:hypothetical protein